MFSAVSLCVRGGPLGVLSILPAIIEAVCSTVQGSCVGIRCPPLSAGLPRSAFLQSDPRPILFTLYSCRLSASTLPTT